MAFLAKPKKSLGQHWLKDPETLKTIANLAHIDKTDTVLEIGPGQGDLTALLLERAEKVIAVEVDNNLANQLAMFLPDKALEIINEDIMKFDLSRMPAHYKLVANIPYYLTSNLIRVISETPNAPDQVVLLLQKEVAQRVAAQPGAMSLLSITAQVYWQVELDQIVPAKLFIPPPKVDSQIIALFKREKPLFSDIDLNQYFRLVKIGFSARRKTLVNSLAAGLRIEKDDVRELLEVAEIDGNTRAQNLSLDEWYTLFKSAESLKII